MIAEPCLLVNAVASSSLRILVQFESLWPVARTAHPEASSLGGFVWWEDREAHDPRYRRAGVCSCEGWSESTVVTTVSSGSFVSV